MVQYVSPSDSHRLAHAELVIVDGAALLVGRGKLLGPYVVSSFYGMGMRYRTSSSETTRETTESPRYDAQSCCRASGGREGNSQQKKVSKGPRAALGQGEQQGPGGAKSTLEN